MLCRYPVLPAAASAAPEHRGTCAAQTPCQRRTLSRQTGSGQGRSGCEGSGMLPQPGRCSSAALCTLCCSTSTDRICLHQGLQTWSCLQIAGHQLPLNSLSDMTGWPKHYRAWLSTAETHILWRVWQGLCQGSLCIHASSSWERWLSSMLVMRKDQGALQGRVALSENAPYRK